MKKDALKYNYVVAGAGRSGIGIAKLLKNRGAQVFLSESSPQDKLMYFDSKLLSDLNINFETGGHSDRIYDCDIMIKSPGISPDNDIIVKAQQKGIKVLSEIEVTSWFVDCPVIAITGTNGKTTTTVLTGEILKNAGFDAVVCGNVGLAFSEVADNLNKDSVVVLEVSSFQLEHTESFKPSVSAIINLTPDHIDWHGSMENYTKSKMKINRNQSEKDIFIYNYDDVNLRSLDNIRGKQVSVSIKEDIESLMINTGVYLPVSYTHLTLPTIYSV